MHYNVPRLNADFTLNPKVQFTPEGTYAKVAINQVLRASAARVWLREAADASAVEVDDIDVYPDWILFTLKPSVKNLRTVETIIDSVMLVAIAMSELFNDEGIIAMTIDPDRRTYMADDSSLYFDPLNK